MRSFLCLLIATRGATQNVSTANAILPASKASLAPANSTVQYLPPGFPKSVDQAAATFKLPPNMEFLTKPGGGYRVANQQHPAAHDPPVKQVERPKHPLTLGEKFEAKTGILKDAHSGGAFGSGYSVNSIGSMINHWEDGEITKVDLSKIITDAAQNPVTFFVVITMLLSMIVGLGTFRLYKLLKERPDLLEDTPPGANDIENAGYAPPTAYYTGLELESRLWARWQHVEATWERSSDFLSFLRVLAHGQARDLTFGLMQSVEGEIEMRAGAYQVPEDTEQLQQTPEEQEQPKQAPQGQSKMQAHEKATDEYQQLLTPR